MIKMRLFCIICIGLALGCQGVPPNSPDSNTLNDGTITSPDAKEVACISSGTTLHIQRIVDQQNLGLAVTEQECETAVEASKNGVVCARENASSSKAWKAININKGHWVGRYPITLEECSHATASSGPGVVCGHTGLTLEGGKTGWKPTTISKPNDQGFMGSSAWLDYCAVATELSHNGIVCANGNGGTGNHAQWYPHYVASGNHTGGGSGTVTDCSKN
jgi:hypothetical protein